MGTLWSEFRRGMRRGKPAPLPAGLTPCERCSEPRGRARFADGGRMMELDITCICDGVPCAWCGQTIVRRPASNRFDAETSEVWHSGAWAAEVPCARCRADGAALPPRSTDIGAYAIGVTPFYGEARAASDYFGGERYRMFEVSIAKLAARYDVRLVDVTRVQGVWRGWREPSAVVSVTGRAGAVLALMTALAREWGQEGVVCFGTGLPGEARMHSGSTHLTVDEVCDRLGDPELPGVTVDADGRVTILDVRGDQSERVRAALTRLGSTGTEVHGRAFLPQLRS